MPKKEDLWYRVGYALEAVRSRLPAPKDGEGRTPAPVGDASHKVLDAFLAVGAGSVLTRIVSLWPGRKRPGLFRLLRAGAAGAAASFLTELAKPALSGRKARRPMEEELTDILFAGIGRGLLYAALVEPRLPGPPLLQGTAYAALEYLLSPWGGLGELAGSEAPQGKVPALSILLKDRGDNEEFVERLAFGVALAILYKG
jgi:hypothetical protein